MLKKTDFNSHAHVERDALNGNYGGYPNISTHTLTWSVTELADILSDCLNISTHTLTWSVTRQLIIINIFKNISTHTLTWSVTAKVYRWMKKL